MKSIKQTRKLRRKIRVRAKVFGTKERPRLAAFRSLKHIYAQLIDDESKITILSASDLELKKSKTKPQKKEGNLSGKTAVAYEVGLFLAEKAVNHKIKKVIFDRGSFAYHGRIKALAEGARAGGLEF